MTGYQWGGRIEVAPKCPQGYTQEQIASIFNTPESLAKFTKWMDGQTGSICDGQSYNHITRKYEPSECGLRGETHGFITYEYDVKRYLGTIKGKDIWD